MYELKGKMVNEDGILWGYLIAKNGRGRYVPKDLALKNLHLINGAYNRRGYVALKHKKMGMVGEYRLSHSLTGGRNIYFPEFYESTLVENKETGKLVCTARGNNTREVKVEDTRNLGVLAEEFIKLQIANDLGYDVPNNYLGRLMGGGVIAFDMDDEIVSLEELLGKKSDGNQDLYDLDSPLFLLEKNLVGIDPVEYTNWVINIFLLDYVLGNKSRHLSEWNFKAVPRGYAPALIKSMGPSGKLLVSNGERVQSAERFIEELVENKLLRTIVLDLISNFDILDYSLIENYIGQYNSELLGILYKTQLGIEKRIKTLKSIIKQVETKEKLKERRLQTF